MSGNKYAFYMFTVILFVISISLLPNLYLISQNYIPVSRNYFSSIWQHCSETPRLALPGTPDACLVRPIHHTIRTLHTSPRYAMPLHTIHVLPTTPRNPRSAPSHQRPPTPGDLRPCSLTPRPACEELLKNEIRK